MIETCKLPRKLEGLEELFAFIDRQMGDHAVDERTAYRATLVAEEIFTNMVRHNEGGAESISFGLEILDDRIGLCLTDHQVAPFEPSTVPEVDVTLPAELRRPGGLGVHLVKSIADRVDYRYEAGEMRVELTIARDS